MSNLSTTQSVLDEHLAQQCPVAIAISSYLESGDITHIEKMPIDGAHRIHELTRIAAKEWDQTPASCAVLEAVLHRVATTAHHPEDELPLSFANMCIESGDGAKQMDHDFIDRCRETGISDFTVALFWLSNPNYSRPTPFQWNGAPILEEIYLSPASYFGLPDSIVVNNAFETLLLELSDDHVLKLLQLAEAGKLAEWQYHGYYQAIIVRDKPAVLKQFIDSADLSLRTLDWRFITANTDQHDDAFLAAYELRKDIPYLIVFDRLRHGQYAELTQAACLANPIDSTKHWMDYPLVLSYLAETAPELLVKKLYKTIQYKTFREMSGQYRIICCRVAAEQWDAGGDKIYAQFDQLLSLDVSEKFIFVRSPAMLSGAASVATKDNAVGQWLASKVAKLPEPNPDEHQMYKLWELVSNNAAVVLEDILWDLLQHKRKTTRNLAVTGLSQTGIAEPVVKATALLDAKKADVRLGAVELLIRISDDNAIAVLQAQLDAKHPAKVHKELVKGLEALGQTQSLDDATTQRPLNDILDDIENNKPAKLPKSTSWLDIKNLPALTTTDGTVLSEKALTHLIGAQAKHKTINPSPDALALLTHIDRHKSGDFAIALLKQWLGSKQEAADRWAMTLAGLLGDKRVLPALTDPINDWAEASRHKLAEYAAQAVALVSADEALMILDSLANRYRSRFRNIGKACKAALEQAAEAQGVTVDELADMIVPTLDFDTEYQRALPDTDIRAALQPDFKLTFFNPKTESETKSPPSSLPDVAVEEIKTVRKLIRETIKGQTARLEQSLVRQRVWSRQRWQELFEVNPFLQSYASRLVWCSLDTNAEPQRWFRRYPNGLLANAQGDVIELDTSDHAIVMAHPLNLADQALQDWIAHLSRMKIKPPFPQLERPTATLDKNHGNRKTLGVAEKHQMLSGTFRSRAERNGWVRGSVIDGGGISSYYKTYSGALVTVFLFTEDFWVGQDPTDTITLGHALFVKADSVQVGSYVYDEPSKTDDPRVLAFEAVPPVIYSETITDLESFIA